MKRGIFILAFVVIAIFANIAYVFFVPQPGLRSKSNNNLKQISLALVVYAADYDNQLPSSLSHLIPDYCYDDKCFYPFPREFKPYTFGNIKEDFYPRDEETRIEFVDSLSPYRLLHLPKTSWAIIHETPGFWEDGGMAWIFLEQNPQDEWFASDYKRGSTQEFEAALKTKLNKH